MVKENNVITENVEIFFSSDNIGIANSKNQAAHRYYYKKVFDEKHKDKILTFIMLNPSNADQYKPDQTIKNIEEITRTSEKGYGAFAVLNLFSYRTPKPKDLIDAINNDKKFSNDENYTNYIVKEKLGTDIVLAWGSSAKSICSKYNEDYYKNVLERLRDSGKPLYTYAKNLNKDGSPKHPGSLSYNKVNKEDKVLTKLSINADFELKLLS